MTQQRLLPDDAYPLFFTDEARDIADDALRALATPLPAEPGVYTDKDGDTWTRNPDGTWTDSEGTTRPIEYNPLLAISAPFSRL